MWHSNENSPFLRSVRFWSLKVMEVWMATADFLDFLFVGDYFRWNMVLFRVFSSNFRFKFSGLPPGFAFKKKHPGKWLDTTSPPRIFPRRRFPQLRGVPIQSTGRCKRSSTWWHGSHGMGKYVPMEGLSGWWVEPTHLKNILSSKWVHLPQIGMKRKMFETTSYSYCKSR